MNSRSATAVPLLALLVTACQGQPGASAPPAASPSPSVASGPQSEDDKTLYALGAILGRNVTAFKLTPAEIERVKEGLADAAAGKPLTVPLETYGPKVQQLASARAMAGAQAEDAQSDAFRQKAASAPGAVKTPSGLVFRTLNPGKGQSPSATSTVRVHYEGTLTNGTVFDSSRKRGEPVEFPLSGVIPCWTEGLQRMKVGERAQLVCPAAIAYGPEGRPPTIPGGATLVFDVELLEVKK
jgi:FKBP-type peptidyl-prolyl cis-trans isomerase FkpA